MCYCSQEFQKLDISQILASSQLNFSLFLTLSQSEAEELYQMRMPRERGWDEAKIRLRRTQDKAWKRVCLKLLFLEHLRYIRCAIVIKS